MTKMTAKLAAVAAMVVMTVTGLGAAANAQASVSRTVVSTIKIGCTTHHSSLDSASALCRNR